MALIPVNDLSRWNPDDLAIINQRIAEVVASGHFMLGQQNHAFELELSDRLGGMGVVSVGNGTDALSIAILGLELEPGSAIITVANAGGYATGAILRTGHVPVLVDTNLFDAQIDIQHLKILLQTTPSVSTVVVTHLYGLMADIRAVCELAAAFGVKVIEDCAQSIGASQDGRWSGAWGDASTFSFYPTKNLGALGDGGAVAFRNESNLAIARQCAQYGWSERYVISTEGGFNTRLDEIQAAVLLHRITSLADQNLRRRQIVRRYSEALSNTRHMVWADNDSYVGHLAVMVSPQRKKDIEALTRNEIGTGIHYPVLDNQQPAWKKYFQDVSLPSSTQLVESIVTLPCFPSMTEEEIQRVCVALAVL